MKDFTLSEIKAHCKERIVKYQNPCKGCEMEVVCKSTLPVGWDIEPRDILDLPCKLKVDANPYKWQVIWRGSCRIYENLFFKEEEADEFLKWIKRDEQ